MSSLALSRILQRPSIQSYVVSQQAANAQATSQATEARMLQQLDGFWQVLSGPGFVSRWDAIDGSSTTKRYRAYRFITPVSTIIGVPGYEIGGAAWIAWMEDVANAYVWIDTTMTYVGVHSNPSGLHFSGVMTPVQQVDADGVLARNFGKIVIDPDARLAHMFDLEFSSKFNDAGWTAIKPTHLTRGGEAVAAGTVTQAELDAFIAEAESTVTVDGVTEGDRL